MPRSSNNANQATLDPDQWVERYGDCLYHLALTRLRDPADAVAGLSFLAYPRLGTGTGSPGAVKRVRLRK